MPTALPVRPDVDWLKKVAKRRLRELRASNSAAKLHQAQLGLAREYGFKSWNALRAHIEALGSSQTDRQRVFRAAKSGDVEAVHRAFANGFDPNTPDKDGRTIHQIAKEKRFEAIELLVRNTQGRESRPHAVVRAIEDICRAAWQGEVEALRQGLDISPELIDALGGDFQKYTALHRATCRNQHACLRLLLDRGADVNKRDFPDNATPLHLAAAVADLETIKILVEAGADVVGQGDDYDVGVLGWATCFRRVREDVAAYLLDRGVPFTLWTAIALNCSNDLRALIARDPSLIRARMSRNLHRRTALHHAAAKNRPNIVRLLIASGADPNVTDATGATPLTTASQEDADPTIVADLLAAGAKLDFLTALNLRYYDKAASMLREGSAGIGPTGRETIALHLAVNKRDETAIQWLIEHGVDVSAKRSMWDCNHTALHMSIESGAIDVAHMLLKAGADPNIRDDKYQATALKWADFFHREDFAKLITQHGGQI